MRARVEGASIVNERAEEGNIQFRRTCATAALVRYQHRHSDSKHTSGGKRKWIPRTRASMRQLRLRTNKRECNAACIVTNGWLYSHALESNARLHCRHLVFVRKCAVANGVGGIDSDGFHIDIYTFHRNPPSTNAIYYIPTWLNFVPFIANKFSLLLLITLLPIILFLSYRHY